MKQMINNKSSVCQPNRLDWVDFAKGIAILLVIVGHTAPYGADLRNYIFSFHMPLFFVLSGYTSKVVEKWSDVWKNMKKKFFGLILPAVFIQILCIILLFIQQADYSLAVAVDLLREQLICMFWASGVAFLGWPALGMLWFIFVLFWGRILWDVISVLFPRGNMLICLFLALSGMFIGQKAYLPQSFDLALVVVLFFCVGQWFKRFDESGYEKYALPLVAAAFCFWLFCCSRGIYIEMASRDYPGMIVSILESICGIVAVAGISREVVQNTVCKNIFCFLGRHSIWIYFIHYIESNVFRFVWQKDNWYYSTVIRVLFDIAIFLAAYICWKILQKYIVKSLHVLREY